MRGEILVGTLKTRKNIKTLKNEKFLLFLASLKKHYT
jgi:hypothetical protein